MAKLNLGNNDKNLNKEKRELIKVAIDLRYPREIVDKINKAQSAIELDRIMKDARSKARV